MKKLLSLGLAMVMCLAMAIPALASSQSFTTENESMSPTIEVDMPSTAGVVLNPYGMTYSGSLVASGTTTKDQIISNVFYITNKTQDVNLEVKTTIKPVKTGKVELVPETDSNLENTGNIAEIGNIHFKDEETGNKVVLALLWNVTRTGSAPTSVTGGVRGGAAKVDYITEEKDLETVVLEQATSSASSYVVYKFTGIAVSKPETAWAEADKVGAQFVYTFTATPDSITSGSGW